MSVSRSFTGIDTATMREWCEILADDNPIHLDPAAAQALGFGPRTVNPGPANLAYLLTLLEDAAPGMTPASLDAAFLGNVLSGDTAMAPPTSSTSTTPSAAPRPTPATSTSRWCPSATTR